MEINREQTASRCIHAVKACHRSSAITLKCYIFHTVELNSGTVKKRGCIVVPGKQIWFAQQMF